MLQETISKLEELCKRKEKSLQVCQVSTTFTVYSLCASEYTLFATADIQDDSQTERCSHC